MSNTSDFIIENGELKKYQGPGGDVVIPDGVTSIGNNAFSQCDSLISVQIPESVKSIGDSAFSWCHSLTSITIPDGVMSIGWQAFSGCSSLTNVRIPRGMRKIGISVFSFSGLTSVTIPEGVTSIENCAFQGCSDLASVTMPESVMSIGWKVFSGCSSLTGVTIPEGVTSIANNTFYNCSALTSVTIPESLKSIGMFAFSGCERLTEIEIPEAVSQIGDEAFAGCKCLTSIKDLEHVTQIGKGVFKGCDAIRIELSEQKTATRDPLSGEYARGSVDTTDRGLAHLILFQRTPLWKAWRNSNDLTDPQSVFDEMLILVQSADPIDKKMAGPVAETILKYYRKLTRESIEKMMGLFQGQKCKEITALEKDENLQAYLSGNTVEKHPAETAAEAFLQRCEGNLEAAKAVSAGIPYADSDALCSREVLIALLSYYMREWDRCADASDSVVLLRDASKIRIDPDADRIADMLNRKGLCAFLEKLINGSKYRPFLLAWARFADDESVARMTSDYRTCLRGTAADSYFAHNLAEAILINPTRTAMLFCDKNGLLDRYAKLRNTTAAELRNTIMLPDLGFDADGVKRFDIGGNTIEARLTDKLSLALYDCGNAKEIRSFPKNSNDPKKAENAAREYAAFKKQVTNLIKLQKEQFLKMYMSGEFVRGELWKKVYLGHPVVARISEHVLWMDEKATLFITDAGTCKDVRLQPVEPNGAVCIAHVLEMTQEEIDAWQHTFVKLGCVQLFEQIWEPIISWDKDRIADRYNGIVISTKERNALKANLRRRGIEAAASEMEREFNGVEYTFSNENTLYFNRTFSLDYTVDPTSGDLTLGLSAVLDESNIREMNAILLELDKITTGARVRRDDISVADLLDRFTLAQITDFISAAQEADANNVLAALLDYKNTHFADFDPMTEFTLDW